MFGTNYFKDTIFTFRFNFSASAVSGRLKRRLKLPLLLSTRRKLLLFADCSRLSPPLPPWVLLLGGVGIVTGLMTYGYKVIATVGQRITELAPSRGFCCEMAAAATVVLASGTGLPISTTHTLVGAVLGVGFARGISALNLRIVGKIFMSWIITLPIGAVLAIIFFFVFKTIFYVPPLTL